LAGFQADDVRRFWHKLNLENDPSPEFAKAIAQAVAGYRHGDDIPVRIAAKDRHAAYNRLENAIKRITNQLTNSSDWLSVELDEASMDFEPENFDESPVAQMGDYAGLSFSDVKRHMVLDQLSEFNEIVVHARNLDHRSAGRIKQNSALEDTIIQLADIAARFTGTPLHKTYTFKPAETDRPFEGVFFEFLYEVIWTHNGRPAPAGAAIGDAARRALKLRK